jgi:predicted small lipoprotein YifL
MKKIMALMLVLAALFTVTACGSERAEIPDVDREISEAADSLEKIISDAATMEETTEPEETDEAEEPDEPEKPEKPEKPESGLRPEFKEAMDSYEAFYDEYCDFMEKYKEDSDNLTLIAKYGKMLVRLEEVNEKFEAWDEDELNSEELKYYLDVNNRVLKKLADLAD